MVKLSSAASGYWLWRNLHGQLWACGGSRDTVGMALARCWRLMVELKVLKAVLGWVEKK